VAAERGTGTYKVAAPLKRSLHFSHVNCKTGVWDRLNIYGFIDVLTAVGAARKVDELEPTVPNMEKLLICGLRVA
jgi:hypothetical protein